MHKIFLSAALIASFSSAFANQPNSTVAVAQEIVKAAATITSSPEPSYQPQAGLLAQGVNNILNGAGIVLNGVWKAGCQVVEATKEYPVIVGGSLIAIAALITGYYYGKSQNAPPANTSKKKQRAESSWSLSSVLKGTALTIAGLGIIGAGAKS